jgi:hypothetical protein
VFGNNLENSVLFQGPRKGTPCQQVVAAVRYLPFSAELPTIPFLTPSFFVLLLVVCRTSRMSSSVGAALVQVRRAPQPLMIVIEIVRIICRDDSLSAPLVEICQTYERNPFRPSKRNQVSKCLLSRPTAPTCLQWLLTRRGSRRRARLHRSSHSRSNSKQGLTALQQQLEVSSDCPLHLSNYWLVQNRAWSV